MALVVLLVLIAVPIVEIAVIIGVGGAIGVVPTVAVLALAALVGAVVVKREGLGLIRRAQDQLRTGADPTPGVLDRVLVIGAGFLLILPGFVSDAVALVLLVPPVRHLLRDDLARRWRRRVATVVSFSGVDGSGVGFARTTVYDARVIEDLGDVTPPQWRHGRSDDADRGELNP